MVHSCVLFSSFALFYSYSRLYIRRKHYFLLLNCNHFQYCILTGCYWLKCFETGKLLKYRNMKIKILSYFIGKATILWRQNDFLPDSHTFWQWNLVKSYHDTEIPMAIRSYPIKFHSYSLFEVHPKHMPDKPF